jgi:hypothetical protein
MNEKAWIWAEFASAERVLSAAKALRRAGKYQLDAYTPFGLPELENELDVRRPFWLPLLVLGGALLAGSLAFVVMWWTASVDYPLDVGGRPLNSIPTDIPIVFESSILGAALAAFALMLFLSRMPRLHHQLETVPGFARTSDDRYWLGAWSSNLDEREQLSELLRRAGALRVHDLRKEAA